MVVTLFINFVILSLQGMTKNKNIQIVGTYAYFATILAIHSPKANILQTH